MSFSELVTAHVERYPEVKMEQVFETARTELAGNLPDLPAIRSKATAGIVFAFNEFQAIRALVNGQQSPSPINDISRIPKADKTSILSPALEVAVSDAVADAIRLHGATDTLSRALGNIRSAYELLLTLLS